MMSSDDPKPGFWKLRELPPKGQWVAPSKRKWVPIYIWFGNPLDPETNEEMDRSPRWNALKSGAPVDVYSVSPYCKEQISESDYDEMIAELGVENG